MNQTIGEIVRKAEADYRQGNTQLSEYVNFSMRDTLDRIDAYLNSKHISGETDSLGREKPFFNIVTAISNVWFRATDIDRSHIKIRATKSKDWIDSFLATIHLREWMRREFFGQFLNRWGKTLSRYGSCVVKFVSKDGLHISVMPWNRMIVDAVDFDAFPKIEVIQLNEAQLKGRIKTHGYDKVQVDALITSSAKARETLIKKKKDNKNNYIKLYEVHGLLSLAHITGKESDEDEFAQQMHVISFVGVREGRKTKYEDFTLFSGREKEDPYMITHLIKEEDRTLSIGSIEHLFESQWMVNHSMKQIKDSIDLGSRMVFQTSDTQFVGRNVLNNIETGDIMVHSTGEPLTLLNNQALNMTAQSNFALQWKQLGGEINSVSEAMLGETPKSGTAWRQTEAVLQESHSLFELMTENKGLQLEEMLRTRIIPYLKTKMDTSEEVSATLELHEINQIDSLYLKNASTKKTNDEMVERVLNGEIIEEGEAEEMQVKNELELKEGLNKFGNQRFFTPDELTDKTWKEQFKDLEWEGEVDITGEASNARENLATLDTALKVVMQPGFEQNERAKMIVGKIFETTGTLSPIEYNSLPATIQPVAGAPEVSAGEIIK